MTTLEGFATPHSHFRVFQTHGAADNGPAGGSDVLLRRFDFGTNASAPSDSHLREFAQLEVQVKALQQRPQTRSSLAPSSRLGDVEHDAALVELFSFYSRLMTPETFSWPDFLTTVFTKLTEHYISSESHTVRKAILEVFQRSQGHVAQISDGGKIVSQLSAQMVKAEASSSIDNRIVMMEFVRVIPNLVHCEAPIHDQLLRSLRSSNAVEFRTAITSTEAVLPHSQELRRIMSRDIFASNSSQTISLLPLAIDKVDFLENQKGWKFCVDQFHNQTDSSMAIDCLKAAEQIANRFPQALFADHITFLDYVIKNDPRFDVVAQSLTVSGDHRTLDPVLRLRFIEIMKQLMHLDSPVDVKYVALRSIRSLLGTDYKETVELVKCADEMSVKHQKLEIACIELVAKALKTELERGAKTSSSSQSTQEAIAILLNILGQQVSSVTWQDRKEVWTSALKEFVALACEHPRELGEPIGILFVKLLRGHRQPNSEEMKRQLWSALSRFSHCCQKVIAANADLFHEHAASTHDRRTRQLIATVVVSNISLSTSMQLVESLLDQCSPSDKVMFAKVPMTQGAFEVAARMLAPTLGGIDHDFSASWSAALLRICQAEEGAKETGVVDMRVCENMVKARQLVQTVSLHSSNLGFQIRYVDARISWLKALSHAQQLIGSTLLTRACSTSRAIELCKLFEDCGEQLSTMRSKMWGAALCDLDVLAYHSHLCFLLATGAIHLLIPQGSDYLIRFKPPRKCSMNYSSLFDGVEMAISAVKLKSRQLATIERSRQGTIGAKILRQLLDEVMSWPKPMPHQFFRCTLSEFTVTSKASFLTHNEVAVFPSKPRPRSQVGVALGTRFSCVLKGAVTFTSTKFTLDDVACIQVTTRLHLADEYLLSVKFGSATTVDETVLQVDGNGPDLLTSNGLAYYPFEIAVNLTDKLISSKGTYILVAEVAVIDRNRECWSVIESAGTRNIIVY